MIYIGIYSDVAVKKQWALVHVWRKYHRSSAVGNTEYTQIDLENRRFTIVK